ncbi:Septum-associated rare lipoprotein A [hydrothermal vent metagenome]|uniref:Septum-associated rare lipoprotein A n=1 Tax=hydrothermal vent metagenome TaxID=652676 RepID=A0A3B0U1H7_9ZZZZ
MVLELINWRLSIRWLKHGAAIGAVLSLVSACSLFSSSHINNQTKFSSSAFGVAASPRVTTSTNVRKGGGRYIVGKPYKVAGRWYRPQENTAYDKTGVASWYGPNFHGRLTANGEIFDQYRLTAAHPTLPLPSYVRVQNLANGRSLIVRVNDRGPFSSSRVIDLSRRAAEVLGYIDDGTARVRVTYVGRAPIEGDDTRYLVASINAPKGALPSASGFGLGRPSIISRQGGGLFGALAGLFSYAPATGDKIVSGAHAAVNAMAARVPPQLAGWRAGIEAATSGKEVSIKLGSYSDAAIGNETARKFAVLGAIDQTMVLAGGQSSMRLVMSYLKPGATIDDVINLANELGVAIGFDKQIAAGK